MDFIVLSSSRGTTFQAIIDRIKDGSLTATCHGLVSDREDRGCVQKARAAGMPVAIVTRTKGESREDYDKRLHVAILEMHPQQKTSKPVNQLTCIAAIGWMYILSPWFIAQWKHRILNVHPSLLPKFPGAHAHEDVLAAGEQESGMTIHLMDEGVDTGPILVQKTCPVLPGDTPETLKARVQELEKEWYPRVLAMIETGEMKLPL